MKTIFKSIGVVALVIVFLFAIAACSGVATSLATPLPPELVAILGMAVMTLVTGAFKWLSSKVGNVDLSDQAQIVAAALSSILVLVINYGLGLIPAAYDNLINGFFSFLIVLLGGTGLYSFYRRLNK
jgi:hypothetical protein